LVEATRAVDGSAVELLPARTEVGVPLGSANNLSSAKPALIE
jgi:hypothetical protein